MRPEPGARSRFSFSGPRTWGRYWPRSRWGSAACCSRCFGGGVFGNPHDLIAEAVVWALAEVDRSGAALDVVVNVYTGDAELFLPDVRARGGAVIEIGRTATVHR